ncbi:Lactonase, 7-bladed beta-propeller-domain-containing protein [Flagelloscypha sp. PMI_526]|nr:Lactonase, 7-bladed beta-propeller-domain-containing protein [Flagelloscypha sp. PMI_526]
MLSFTRFSLYALLGVVQIVVGHRSNPNSSAVKILVGGYAAPTVLLEFDPYSQPNTLRVLSQSDGGSQENKAWLSRHPVSTNILLSCNDHAIANATGYLQSYSLDPTSGAIQFIDQVDAGGFQTDFGVASAHAAFFPPLGNVAGVANYYGQTAATFVFNPETGKFGKKLNKGDILEFPGYKTQDGQVADRQESSHPHMIAFHPYLNTFYLPDLGEDLIHIFTYDESGGLTNLDKYQVPIGSGPRHLAFSPSGQYSYILHELIASISVHQIDVAKNGTLTMIQEPIPIYPSNATLNSNLSSAEVHVSNDGRFIYATMRNLTDISAVGPADPSDIISVFEVSQTNGTLSKIQEAMFPGARQLRAMELSPAGSTASAGGQSFVVTGGILTNNTAVFKRDTKSGLLEFLASVDHPDVSPSTYIWI